MWTIVPAILKLPEISDWTIVAEDTSEININQLEKFTKSKSSADMVFSGFGLKDKELVMKITRNYLKNILGQQSFTILE